VYMGRLGKYLGKPKCFSCSAGEIEPGLTAKNGPHSMLVHGPLEALEFGVRAREIVLGIKVDTRNWAPHKEHCFHHA
jgi:hypothetical protein